MKWEIVTSDCGCTARVEDAAFQFQSALGVFHYQGKMQIEKHKETNQFCIAVHAVEVMWYADGSKRAGNKVIFSIFLPTDGGKWTVIPKKTKSAKDPTKKTQSVNVTFPPTNSFGIYHAEIYIQVGSGGENAVVAEVFVAALMHANKMSTA